MQFPILDFGLDHFTSHLQLFMREIMRFRRCCVSYLKHASDFWPLGTQGKSTRKQFQTKTDTCTNLLRFIWQ